MEQSAPVTDPFSAALGRLNRLLYSLSDESTRDRGALASLRKGIGEPGGWHPAVSMVVDRALGELDLPRSEQDVLYLTATLFSIHPQMAQHEEGARPPSLMTSLNRLMEAQGRTTDDGRASIDRRVMALLNADQADLAHHLRHLIALFRNSGVAIDWSQLARDLRWWDATERTVQRRWAHDWWRSSESSSRQETAESTP